MKITNFSDFDRLKKEIAESPQKDIEIRVAYATCGITAGAKMVVDALKEELAQHNLPSVDLITTGCLGACYAEPTVMVTKGGVETLFGYVDAARAKEIVAEFIVKDEEVQGVIK